MRLLVVALIGCGQGLPPTTTLDLVEQTAGKPVSTQFTVVPAELGDDGAIGRIRHRVRVRWMRDASPIHGEDTEPVIARAHVEEVDIVLPVIGESEKEIRVVAEDDDARLALWIDRRDSWPIPLVPIQLADREGRVHRTSGAFMKTGAPIDVAYGRDRTRHVTLRDPDLAVEGWVPAAVLGSVWIAPVGEKIDIDTTFTTSGYTPPEDKRPSTRFVKRATIRAAPNSTAPIMAIVLGEEVTGFVITRGAWTEVEIPREHARVRGFVKATELAAAKDEYSGHGSGSGTGFGMSHTDRIVVPAGACLYDKPDGQVVGVQIKEQERMGERTDRTWPRVYVNSPWSVIGLFVHDTNSDPAVETFEICRR